MCSIVVTVSEPKKQGRLAVLLSSGLPPLNYKKEYLGTLLPGVLLACQKLPFERGKGPLLMAGNGFGREHLRWKRDAIRYHNRGRHSGCPKDRHLCCTGFQRGPTKGRQQLLTYHSGQSYCIRRFLVIDNVIDITICVIHKCAWLQNLFPMDFPLTSWTLISLQSRQRGTKMPLHLYFQFYVKNSVSYLTDVVSDELVKINHNDSDSHYEWLSRVVRRDPNANHRWKEFFCFSLAYSYLHSAGDALLAFWASCCA